MNVLEGRKGGVGTLTNFRIRKLRIYYMVVCPRYCPVNIRTHGHNHKPSFNCCQSLVVRLAEFSSFTTGDHEGTGITVTHHCHQVALLSQICLKIEIIQRLFSSPGLAQMLDQI